MLIPCWLALAAGALPADDLADRVFADVNGQIVLESDTRIDARLSAVDPGETPFWSDLWGSSRDRVVDAAVIRVVAAEVGIYTPAEEAVRARLDALQARLGGAVELRAFRRELGLQERALVEVLRRRLVVDLYLLRNLRADPSNGLAWRGEAKEHVRRLQSRLRIRTIPIQSPRPSPTP